MSIRNNLKVNASKNFKRIQRLIPKDTGNLKFSASRIIQRPDGYDIYIGGSKAPYAKNLQDGKPYKQHKGFINPVIVGELVNLIKQQTKTVNKSNKSAKGKAQMLNKAKVKK